MFILAEGNYTESIPQGDYGAAGAGGVTSLLRKRKKATISEIRKENYIEMVAEFRKMEKTEISETKKPLSVDVGKACVSPCLYTVYTVSIVLSIVKS